MIAIAPEEDTTSMRTRHTGPSAMPEPGRSLRWRWNRAFALLTVIVVVSGLAGLVGASLVVDIFRSSAFRAESEATTNARLRSEVVAQSVVVASAVTPSWRAQVDASRTATAADFAEAITTEDTPRAKQLLQNSRTQWLEIADSIGLAGEPTALAVRGAAVSTHAPLALAFLDQAGEVNREAVRSDLRSASRTNWEAMGVLSLLDVLAIALAVLLSRRFSWQVLRPLVILRDSANQLAAGELDHRVVVDRDDELGELAVSFNAMADAIAGSQRTLTHEANTDVLSGLANRAAFAARLDALLARPDRRGLQQAVLFVDLDDFKDVNDTMGHAAGDKLLKVVSERLTQTVRPGDLVSRLGGDEFALLLDDLPDPEFACDVAQRVVGALAERVRIGESWAHVGASVGLAMRRDDSTRDGLMREADVAMYAAKAKGKNRVERYDAGLDDLAVARNLLKLDLGDAVDKGELVLDYQPMVDLESGLLVGVEALVRWQHPTRGLLPPSEFIELAEETGAILSIGAFVLSHAAEQVQVWQRRYGLPTLWLSVNVSVCQLGRPDFAAQVAGTLQATRLDPSSLVLEVTETILAEPQGGVSPTLEALRATGIRIALDDFGTGFSSIGYLRQIPVDILKIDRSFVAGTYAGGQANALLEAIVGMAERLGLDVIPEGIEEFDQLVRLRAMGCRVGQGFLLCRPVSGDAIDALLAASIPFAHIGLHEVHAT
jgi:diguanylate cyclase (GGDEF)-like protein